MSLFVAMGMPKSSTWEFLQILRERAATKWLSNNYKFAENNLIHWLFSITCCLLILSHPEFRLILNHPEFRPMCFVYFLLFGFFLIVDEDQLSFHLGRNGRLSSSNHRVHNQETNSWRSCWKHYRYLLLQFQLASGYSKSD